MVIKLGWERVPGVQPGLILVTGFVDTLHRVIRRALKPPEVAQALVQGTSPDA